MDTIVDAPPRPRPPTPADGGGGGRSGPPRRPWWRWSWNGRRLESRRIMPALIQVLAGFSKIDGEVIEADIDASISFLRNDFPTEYHPGLRTTYQEELNRPQNLAELAATLAQMLDHEEKILLGIQLYVLISRARMPAQLLKHFYLFMTSLGVAAEAVGLVYQLNVGQDQAVPAGESAGAQPLESLVIGATEPADLVLDHLPRGQAIAIFRLRNLVLLKNTGTLPLLARGRQIECGEFSRLYLGQRVVLGEVVLDYQDLISYLNAKKDVSSTHLFFSIDETDQPYVERTRSPESLFEIKFGLGVEVRALRSTRARVKGVNLRVGERLKASLNDKITFPDRTEITLAELRRRAREMGGRFALSPSKSDYLVSTNSSLLRPGDILLSPSARGELLLRINCDYESKSGELEVLQADRPVFVRRQPVKERTPLRDGEIIDIGEGLFLRCHFGDRIIEEERNIISRIDVTNLLHRFTRRETALDDVTLSARRGEMICVMGPSGCGKSTFLRVVAGHLKPSEGTVQLNGTSLYDNLSALRPYIAYVPHDDSYDPLLTVAENLNLAAGVRSPNLSGSDRRKRVDAKLVELGLDAVRRRRSGTPEEKTLSGGERKRLNIGLDMISLADVFLFDEPTSGLSSKDSEHVLEIIRGLAHNKIVFVSIHQPSARLFSMFHKALLLDRGGRVAFFGTPDEMLAYFAEAAEEEKVRLDLPTEVLLREEKALPPEFIFDVMESPLRDLGGDIIYAEDKRGRLAPARRFSPGFWRDRFQARRILEQTRQIVPSVAGTEPRAEPSAPSRQPQRLKRHLKDEFAQFFALVRRAFLSKLRHRTNLVTTLLEAPLLAILIASVLRYSEDGTYTFASAFHIPTYLFLSLVVAMFLGLTNSADDIVRDRVVLQRERNHNIRCSYYVVAKILSLSAFALAQCVIYLLIGNSILEVQDMFRIYLWWMFLTSVTGVVLGLVISSLVNEGKTATNIIPLVLVPQIILGGALIKYEEMNRNLDLVYNLKRWLKSDTGQAMEPSNRLEVPSICEVMPLRWSYEAIIISQATKNPIAVAQARLQERIDTIVQQLPKPPAKDPPELAKALRDTKDALALISGLEARSAEALSRQIDRILTAVEEGNFDVDAEEFEIKGSERQISGAQVYVNQKVWDLYHKAENERLSDAYKQAPNVFFGRYKYPRLSVPDEVKHIPDIRAAIERMNRPLSTLTADATALFLFIGAGTIVLYVSLRWRLTRV